MIVKNVNISGGLVIGFSAAMCESAARNLAGKLKIDNAFTRVPRVPPTAIFRMVLVFLISFLFRLCPKDQ